MDDDADNRSLAEWAAKDGGAEGGSADADAAQAAQAAEAAKAAEIFAASKDAPAEEPTAEKPAVAEAEAPAEPEPGETPPVAEPARPAKKPVAPLPAWMKDRLAEQTAKQRDAERLAAEARARAEVAEAELAELRKRGASGDATPAAKDTPGADFVPRTQVEARAAEIARMDAFNASADQAYFAGKDAYKEDFDAALQPLQAMGAMSRMDFQEAALATGAAHDVLYELGSDPDKASEILGYLKTGRAAKATAEMTRIADKVKAQKAADEAAATAAKAPKKTPVSAVPAPIRPVGGSALPTVDLDKADDEQFDSVFAPMMKKLGWN
jgi:hypothetical protein